MDEMKVLIVEDDARACNAFSAYVETLADVNLVGATADAKEAVKIICAARPHAVILDLELSGGDGSGLDVLRGVKEARLGYAPFFLITTVTTSNVLHAEVRSLGGAFIMAKHMPSYSEVYAIDFLRKMSGSILREAGRVEELPTAERQNQRIRQMITAEMNWIGVSPKMKGRSYLMDAIELLVEGPQSNLYDSLASRHNKTADSIEQAMKYAIEKAWKTTDVDVLCDHFKARVRSGTGVPTTTEFVYYYAEKIRTELRL